ncbi:MAG: glycosyl hydrolase [Verrucomicrobiales bacterium]|nr:glycosyl hydrolase [Verrucomicrobiales bacterium]
MFLRSFSVSAYLFLFAGTLLAQEVVFEADFDAAAEVSGSVTANATAANLNSGTSVGTWNLPGTAPGAIISDGGTNNAFVFDKATSGSGTNAARAIFDRSVALRSETLTLELDLYATRQAGGQSVIFSLEDASGDKAYEFVFRMNNTKSVYTVDSSGSEWLTSNNSGVNSGFTNPVVDGHLSWGSGMMTRVKLEISNLVTGADNCGAALSVDWNGDGDFTDGPELEGVGFGPRNADVAEISSLRIANFNNVGGGAWVDNLTVTAQDGPAPSSLTDHNLAKYQVTRASSSRGDFPPQFATDGLVTEDSRWRSDPAATGPHWLEVELAVPMPIDSAHVFSGGTFDTKLTNFELQYHDGSDWVTIPETSVTGNTAPELNLAFTNPVTAQRFRLLSPDAVVNLLELALFPPASGGGPVPFGTDVDLNLAKLRQYTYSSVEGAGYPKLAIDGYSHSCSAWRSADAAGPHDLEIHFPRTEKISGIHLYSGYEGQAGTQIQDFEIAYDNGGTWVVFDGGSITGNTDFDRSVQFNAPANTKKIRLRSLDAKQAIVRELVVLYGTGGPWYPLGTDVLNEVPPQDDFLEYGDHFYTLENVANGLNLSTSLTGADLTAEDPHYQVLLNFGTNSFRIRSRETEACFEVSQASTTAGAAIVEGGYSSMPHQRWQLVPVGSGSDFRILNVWSGMALAWDGSAVVQEAAANDPDQLWRINYETHFPKKGQASHFHFSSLFQSNWGYRWNFAEENQLQSGQYMPMQWGGIAAAAPGILDYQHLWYRRANQTTLMGFNEPNLSDQANMTEATAAYQWPRLQRTRLPLLGPCPSNFNGSWRQNYEALAAEQGHRSDYMAMHWYSTAGAASGSPSQLINNMQTLYNAYGKPIWLTEFSTRDFVGNKTTWSRNHNYNFLAEFAWRAESLPWLAKWCLFEWGISGGDPNTTDASSANPFDMNSPRLSLHYNNDSADPGWEDLAECGLLLAGWDGKDYLVDDTSYIIHNKGRFLRLIDNPDSATPTTANVLNRTATEQFILESAPGGKKYITGLSDGRRLSYNGSSVGFAAKDTTGPTVEWQLNEHQHGWFHIDHPSSGRRLHITGTNTVNTVSGGTANDNVRFRFIKHYLPITMTEVQPLPYFEGFENGIGAWRQFYDDDYDWELGTGNTPTASAGPAGAAGGDFYLFAEGHDTPSANAVTHVEATFDFSTVSNVELRFDYHMNGFYIDYLAVDIYDGTTWHADVWRRNGQQMTETTAPWLTARIDLTAYVGNPEVKVRFRTATTSFNSADPAIDNISLLETSNSLPYAESFEYGFGTWSQVQDDDIDWTHHTGGTATNATGPSQASDGDYYLYFEAHDDGAHNKIASVENTFDFSAAFNPELKFDYHMFGVNIEFLAVDVHDGTSWTTDVWVLNGPQQSASTDPWLSATVSLLNYAGLSNVTIRFRAQQRYWHVADTAIDNIIIEEGPPTPYLLWASTAFAGAPPGTDRSKGGNPDGDEFTNVEEWVLVLNPLTPDSPVLTTTQAGGNLVVTFNRRSVGDPYVRAAWSETLLPGSWRYDGDGLTESLQSTSGDIESMSASVPIDLPRKFIRLELWYAPE